MQMAETVPSGGFPQTSRLEIHPLGACEHTKVRPTIWCNQLSLNSSPQNSL